MRLIKHHIIGLLAVLLFTACVSQHHTTLRNLPKPGKQCKILSKEKFSDKVKISKKQKRSQNDPLPQLDQTKLQAKLMTNEEYLEQIEKVKKSLPQFDIENDCPPAFQKPKKKKKFSLKSLFKKSDNGLVDK